MNKINLLRPLRQRFTWWRYQLALRAYRAANERSEALRLVDDEIDLDPSQWREVPVSLLRDLRES